jgi:hypothetical protein
VFELLLDYQSSLSHEMRMIGYYINDFNDFSRAEGTYIKQNFHPQTHATTTINKLLHDREE